MTQPRVNPRERQSSQQPPSRAQGTQHIPARAAPTAVGALWRFALDELPKLNRDVRDGLTRTEVLLGRARLVLMHVETVMPFLEAADREALFLPLGFIAASAERHWQVAGHQPGEVYTQLPGLEAALVTAAGTGRVPYLTAYDLWLDNTVPRVVFLDDSAHEYFYESVGTQNTLHTWANHSLGTVVTGEAVPGTPQCLVMMQMAASAMTLSRLLYQRMTNGISPQGFTEFRSWLPPTVVGGVRYPGPNAAWLHEMVRTDLLFGTADDAYPRDTVRPTLHLFSAEGQRVLADDLWASQTVVDVFATALGFPDAHALAAAPDEQVAEAVGDASRITRETLEALVATWKGIVGASAAHWAQIQRCLIRHVFTAEELAAMTVKPSAGTGGHSHADTWAIHVMRKNCPPVLKIAAALQSRG